MVEKPGALDGLVKAPAEKFLPERLRARGRLRGADEPKAKLASKKLKVKGEKATAKVACPEAFDACNDGKLSLKAKGKGKDNGRLASSSARIAGGKTAKLKMKLSKQGEQGPEEEAEAQGRDDDLDRRDRRRCTGTRTASSREAKKKKLGAAGARRPQRPSPAC